MDKHIQILLNRVSYISLTIATSILILLYLQTPQTCIPNNNNNNIPIKPHQRFPRSSCDALTRQVISLDKKNQRLWQSKSWQKQIFSYTQLFNSLKDHNFSFVFQNHSRVLCISAGAGHEVMALNQMGVLDVTGVELVESPPLVSRADPHNLPFFDNVFDVAFTKHLEQALFPKRFVAEMERTVRPGGFCVVVLDRDCEVKEVVRLFERSKLFSVVNVSLIGSEWTRILMRVQASS